MGNLNLLEVLNLKISGIKYIGKGVEKTRRNP
jgi:hypothetical protein